MLADPPRPYSIVPLILEGPRRMSGRQRGRRDCRNDTRNASTRAKRGRRRITPAALGAQQRRRRRKGELMMLLLRLRLLEAPPPFGSLSVRSLLPQFASNKSLFGRALFIRGRAKARVERVHKEGR